MAVMHIIGQPVYCGGETMDILGRLAQQMQGQAQSAAGAHSRKGADGFHSVFQQS